MREYALYKGEELLSIGTLEELAAERGVTPNTIYFYTKPVYQRRARKKGNSNRLFAIKLED